MPKKKDDWGFINPRLKDYLKEHPERTLLGLWWAMTWRLNIVLAGIYLLFYLVISL